MSNPFRDLHNLFSGLARGLNRIEGIVGDQVPKGQLHPDSRRQIVEIGKGVDEVGAKLKTLKEKQITAYSQLAPSLLASSETAMSLLANDDPKLRVAALRVIALRWPKHPGFAARCETIALSDAEDRVRTAAIISLGDSLHGSQDKHASQIFATVAADKRLPPDMRASAYRSLLAVQNPDSLFDDPLLENANTMRDMGLANWSLINRFAIPSDAEEEP